MTGANSVVRKVQNAVDKTSKGRDEESFTSSHSFFFGVNRNKNPLGLKEAPKSLIKVYSAKRGKPVSFSCLGVGRK